VKLTNDVSLSWAEMLLGCFAGCMRQVQNMKDARHNAYGMPDKLSWGENIEGVLAEMALAKALNKYWCGKGEFGDVDIRPDIECRSTSGHDNRLILHKSDKDERKYYLITGQRGNYEVKGWCYGHDGKKTNFYDDPTGKNRPAYFVPQSELTPPARIWN
jgi:hypothetical protein